MPAHRASNAASCFATSSSAVVVGVNSYSAGKRKPSTLLRFRCGECARGARPCDRASIRRPGQPRRDAALRDRYSSDRRYPVDHLSCAEPLGEDDPHRLPGRSGLAAASRPSGASPASTPSTLRTRRTRATAMPISLPGTSTRGHDRALQRHANLATPAGRPPRRAAGPVGRPRARPPRLERWKRGRGGARLRCWKRRSDRQGFRRLWQRAGNDLSAQVFFVDAETLKDSRAHARGLSKHPKQHVLAADVDAE